jgi:hypothetical protein
MLLATPSAAQGETNTLLDWDESGATGRVWPNWLWFNDASGYGDAGWRRHDADADWLMPRLHSKTDYGNRVTGEIDTEQRAPGTTGGSLKISNTGGDSTAAWWFLWRDNFGTQGLANSTTNRLSFYFRPSGFSSTTWSGDIDSYNAHFGTYLCWSGAGDGCPKEAAGQHYYHHLTVNPDAWLHVVLDRHPQHQRGDQTVPSDNPAGSRNYYQHMNGFYLELFAGSSPQQYWVDEMEFSQADQPENDISISSVWVGYWPSTNKWEMGWQDGSFGTYGNDTGSTFEIRWSTSPITNENFSSANLVQPDFNGVGNNRVQRPNSWKLPAWTRFSLPVSTPATTYFAIKDVSSTGNGDGHNSPSPYIKTIDYRFSAGSNQAPPAQPSSVQVN